MQRFICLLLFSALSITARPQSGWHHGRLQPSANAHYLQYEDGTPFFWLGDTGWELFCRLTLPEIKFYLDNRAAKGFNVIQAVVFSEFSIRKENRYGDLSMKNMDPLNPNEKYFSLIDSVVQLAADDGIFMALVATWGDKVNKMWGEGPVLFDSSRAYKYGYWLGNRYKNFPNIIWILGGDRPAIEDTANYIPVWRAMAKGIIDATHHQCLITYHPNGEKSSSAWLQNESWLNFNMMQSSHGRHDAPVWEWIRKDWALSPVKPVLDAEPNYEDHPVAPWPKWHVDSGYFRDYDVRKQLYRSVFAGGCGVTYGHHAIWQFLSEREEVINFADRGWVNALDRPGAYQAGYLKKLMESRPVLTRIPDPTMIVSGQDEKGGRIEAFHDEANSYAMVYLPVGKKITINTGFMKCNNINAWWFNPKDGSVIKTGLLKRTNNMEFTAPVPGLQNDWVLVIDDASKRYGEPGK
jgi:hypothetical protein